MKKVFGIVTDINGTPLAGADVQIKDKNYETLYSAVTKADGTYELEAEEGLYNSLFICKDYGINNLEYWAWNVPIFDELELNATINGLELYGIRTFKIPQGSTLCIYFRPMSLYRFKALNQDDMENELFDITPKVIESGLKVKINNKIAQVMEINKVLEGNYDSEGHYKKMYGYQVQVELDPQTDYIDSHAKIHIELRDDTTGEYGEGTYFWRVEEYI